MVLQATVNKMYTCMCTSITHPDSSPRQLQSLLEASNTFIQPGHEANTRQLNTPAVEQTLRVQRKYESAPATGLRPLSVSNETRAPNSNLAINIDTSRGQSNIGQPGVGDMGGSLYRGRWADSHPTSESSAVDTDDAAGVRSDDGDFTLVENRRAKRRRVRRSPGIEAPAPRASGPPAAASGQPGKAPVPSFAAVAKKPPRKPLVVGALRSPPSHSATSITGQVASVAIAGGKRLAAAKPYLGKAVFCVDNVSKDVTADDVKQFVVRMGVRVLDCNNAKPRRTRKQKPNDEIPDHKAFYLCINKADTGLLLDPSKWPADVTVSAWFFRKKDDVDEQQTTTRPPTAGDSGASVAVNAGADVITVTADVHQPDASAADAANVETEMMSLSPIVANSAAAQTANDNSDVFAEASDSMQAADAHNSTTVQVVDLSTIITS